MNTGPQEHIDCTVRIKAFVFTSWLQHLQTLLLGWSRNTAKRVRVPACVGRHMQYVGVSTSRANPSLRLSVDICTATQGCQTEYALRGTFQPVRLLPVAATSVSAIESSRGVCTPVASVNDSVAYNGTPFLSWLFARGPSTWSDVSGDAGRGLLLSSGVWVW